MKTDNYTNSGFTIVELLVVIVVIGILAAITAASYSVIQRKAVTSTVQADLASAANKIRMYQVDNDIFPTTIDCSASPVSGSICLKPSGNNLYTALQTNIAASTFCLSAKNSNSLSYRIDENSSVSAGACNEMITSGLVLHLDATNPTSYVGSGATWNDLSGNSYTTSLIGGVGYSSDYGSSITFDGINDYASIGSTVNLGTVWSVIVPLRFFKNSKTFQFFLGTNANTGNVGKILLSHSDYITFSYPAGTYNHFSVLSSEIDNINSHLSFVSNGTTVSLYINGVLRSTITPSGTALSADLIANAWSDLAWTSTVNVYGIDFYNRELTGAEVLYKFNAVRSRYGL